MKKALPIIRRTLTVLFLAFAVVVMIFTIFSVTSFEKETGIFGYKFFIVLSDSMQSDFDVGDVAVSKEADASTLQEGDIITFKSIDPANYGAIVTHKIREKTTYEGKPAFITYGTTTGADDATPALEENVVGQYIYNIPKAGYVFSFLKSPAGYITLIFVPFFIVILFESIRFFGLLKKYKKEQQADIEAQKAEIFEEKQKTEQMLAEIAQIKAELEKKEAVANQDANER